VENELRQIRVCPACKIPKNQFTDFHRSKLSKSGFAYRCKECNAAYNKRYHEKNKERANAVSTKYDSDRPRRVWARSSFYFHKKKGFDMQISLQFLYLLASKTDMCSLCDRRLNWGYGTKNGLACPGSPSLDRIDNESIISSGNTQIICQQCNRTKGDRTQAEFLEYCKMIARKVTCTD